jgi:hypothetical protein
MAIGLIASEPERMTQTELAQLLGLEDASMVPLVQAPGVCGQMQEMGKCTSMR